MKQKKLPVFYDKSGARWRIFLVTTFLITSGVGIILGLLILNILKGAKLTNHTPYQYQAKPPNTPKVSMVAAAEQTSLTTEGQQIIAYYVNWDDKSFASLQQNSQNITELIPEWLHLKNSLGEISIDNRSKQVQVIDYLSKEAPNIKIVPLINNFNPVTDTWDDILLNQILINPESQKALINNIYNYVIDNKFSGINIDFENLSPEFNSYLVTFMTDLSNKFHESALTVSQSLPADDDSLNYSGLTNPNDYIILMAYDEHWSTNIPGPISSQAWFSTILAKRAVDIPPQKLIVGLGNYGYNWESGQVEGIEVTFQDALFISKEFSAPIIYDPLYLNPTFTYNDKTGSQHNVWFLDGTTIFNQLLEAQKFNPKGFAIWRLGSEDPSTWQVLTNLKELNTELISNLENLQEGYGITSNGKGEIIESVEYPKAGKRKINYDTLTGLITSEEITEYSNPIIIKNTGSTTLKSIALTFDDGPNAEYTPKILDILKRNNIKATFFVTGTNANINPSILKRIYNEGHEIGIHTFTHPNISKISEGELALEINSTQELIKSKLNVKTLLFRPPYGEDDTPQTIQEIMRLKEVSSMGYYNVLMGIDPNDWANPGVEKIVESVINQVDSNKGNIILLHDSGGDRLQTIAALKPIIEQLKLRGYNFVGVSSLLNTDRDHIMPKEASPKYLGLNINSVGFNFFEFLYKALKMVFFFGVILGIYRLFVIIVFATIQKKFVHKKIKSKFNPFVSVLVPAFNEEKIIVRTINNILSSSYKKIEIIVIDDGSTDNTYETALSVFKDNKKVKILKTEANIGKSEALNLGVKESKGEIIVVQDADSIIIKRTISNIVKHFSDEHVGAVAGNVRVGNRVNLLTKLQALEYISSQNLDKRAFDLLNCITIVPGAIGAWRKSGIIEAGGFNPNTFAEDAELTVRIIGLGYKVVYEEKAIAYTEAPQDIKSFLRQRFRWMFGTLQYLRLHIRMLFNFRYGFLGLFSLPNVLIFHIFFSLIGPLIDLFFVFSIIYNLWQKLSHPSFSLNTLYINISAYVLFLVVDFITQFIAFSLEEEKDYKLIVWLPFQRLFYRQLFYFVALKTALTAIKGTLVEWNKLKRSGVFTQG